jgi:TolB-like protein
MQVITKENLLVLLEAQGKSIEACEGECEVDTGRMVGADYVVSGEALRVGSHFKINLKLHETRSARLLGQGVASGHTLDELDGETQKVVTQLVQALR